MSLLLQLLDTLLFCSIWELFGTVYADNNTNITNDDKVCSELAIEYEGNNLILQKQSYSLYNRSVWSLYNSIYVSYDGWTNSWETLLPTSSYVPDIYRVESTQIIPPSTQWTNKWTQNKMSITYSCQDASSTDPTEIQYPYNLGSCAQIINYLNHSIPNGIYYIELSEKTIQVFCYFDLENEFAWTLVESFSQFFASSLYSLSFNLGINAKNPNERDNIYRLSIAQMTAIQSISTHNLVTCNFDLSLTRDYVLLDNELNGWNILTKTRSICRPVKEINIRGYQCNDGTAPFWTLSNHFHVDSSYTSTECSCDEWTDTAVKNEDNFGQYSYYNPQHACTFTNTSTTNVWMGSDIIIPTFPPTTAPTTTHQPTSTSTPLLTVTTHEPTVITCPPCECTHTTQDTEPCPTFSNDCSICPTIEPEPCTTSTPLIPVTDEPCPTFECQCPTITPEPCPTCPTHTSIPCPSCPILTPEPCIKTTQEPLIMTTEMCPPCTTEDIPDTTTHTVLNTTYCPKCATCEECEPCHTETSSEQPCPTETITVYRNVTCPTPTPCPTLTVDTDITTKVPTINPTTTTTKTIVITDCEMCELECKDWSPTTTTSSAPSVATTGKPTTSSVLITEEPKAITNYSLTIELLVKYESMHDLCPSDVFNDYVLELSTCQVLDMESIFCEVEDITSITTIQSVSSSIQRRRQLIDYDGFDIAILMQISAIDDPDLDIIDRLVHEDDFASTIDEKWQQNAVNYDIIVGRIVSIITEYDTSTITPSPTEVMDIYSTYPPTRADYYFVQSDSNGVLNLDQSIGLFFAVALVVLCVTMICIHCVNRYNKSKLDVPGEQSEGAIYNTEPDEEDPIPSQHKDILEQVHMEENEAIHHPIGSPQRNELIEEDEKTSSQYVIEIDDMDFDSILKNNGIAEFEDSDLRVDKSELIALPTTMGAHYRSTPAPFVRQNGPVISQMSVQKYHDLVTQKKWLDELERELSEIQATESQPGAYNMPESIHELHSELKRLNAGMKGMLTQLGYGLVLGAQDEEEDDKIVQCIKYAQYINDEIINKYGADMVRDLLGDEDTLDMKALEEKRKALLRQTKRSSRKVSKTYLQMQKGGGKQKYLTSQHGRGRGKSRDSQTDETGSMSGVSETEKELEATNDNDVMKQYVLAPMKSNSKTYKMKQDDILKTMPDSPSLSSVHVHTPNALTSDATRRRAWSKPRSERNQGTRDSAEIKYDQNDECGLEEIEDEVVRYNDPPPHHPRKKYSGYVPKAIDRLDTTGKLPTPSKSDQQYTPEPEQRRGSDFERALSQHLEEHAQTQQEDTDQYTRNVKPAGLPPKPPPPSRGDQKDHEDDDNQYYDEDDDDLKEPFLDVATKTIGLHEPVYDDEYIFRGRGNSNASSDSNSDGASLNSADSSVMSELSKSRQQNKQPLIVPGYAPNVPIHSESQSTGTGTEQDIDIKEKDKTDKEKGKDKDKDKSVKKKKKKMKAPKKPKIKSPFFESDAAITKSKKEEKKKGLKSKKKKKKEPERQRFKFRGKGTGVTPKEVVVKKKKPKGKKKKKDKTKSKSEKKSSEK